MTTRGRIAAAAAAGLIGALAFPAPGWWPLSFVAWAPLLVAVDGVRARRGALLGLISGVVFFAMVLRWLAPLTIGGMVALVLYLALYPALFGATAAWLLGGRTRVARAATAPLWVATEWIRGWLFTGFGWGALGYALAPAPLLIQLAAVGGVPLLSLAVMTSNLLVAGACPHLAAQRWRVAAVRLGAAAAVPAAMAGWGALATRGDDGGETLRVAAVQGDISPYQKWGRDGVYVSFTRYVELSGRAAAEHPDLIVWPETAIPAPLDEGQELGLRARGLRRQVEEVWRTPLLFGVTEAVPGSRRFFNTAVLFDAGGSHPPAYRKRRLVPFGEYRPWPWMPKVVPGPEYQAGDGGTPFAVAGAHVGVLICFEDVFVDEALARARGADLLAIITNDGYFARAGHLQHLQFAVLRAVETGRSIVRAGNTGISAIIDRRGRVVERAPAGPQVVTGTLTRSTARTPLSRAPDAVPLAALAAALAAVVAEFVRRTRRSRA